MSESPAPNWTFRPTLAESVDPFAFRVASGWENATERADRITALAECLQTNRPQILSTAAEETALTHEELAPEFARMTGTLRMFADLLRNGSWVRASIDVTASEAIGP